MSPGCSFFTKYGGVYADLDTECLRPLDALLDGQEFVIGLEPEEQARGHREGMLLSNAVVASIANHPFLKELIQAFSESSVDYCTHRDVLEGTGPILYTRVYERYTGPDLTVVPAVTFSPLAANSELLKEFYLKGTEAIRHEALGRGAYVVHYWSNTWVSGLAGELNNPHPREIPGFRFYPHLDSPGNDLSNGGAKYSPFGGNVSL